MGTRSLSQVNANRKVNVNTKNGQSKTVYGSEFGKSVQQVSHVQEVQSAEPVVSAAAESEWQRIQQRIADQHRQRVFSTIQAETLSQSAGS